MIDYDATLQTALATILPTHYEQFINKDTATPCITFIENTNRSTIKGDTVSYSKISYTIKIWGKQMTALKQHALLVDTKMNQLGFTRAGYYELVDGSMISLIFTYEATAQEGTNSWY